MKLRENQRAFQAQILADGLPLPATWDIGMAKGLAIYRNAYRSRLIEALEEIFPLSARWVGGTSFEKAAIHHIITHPPAGWTLDLAGSDFPATCAQIFARDPEVPELAWLEWAMHRAFTAADCTPLDQDGFAAATTGFGEPDWAGMLLAFTPGIACRIVNTRCVAIWQALHAGGDGPEDVALPEATGLLVWREGLRPVFQTIAVDEAEAIARIRNGAPFGDICEWLHTRRGDEAAALAGSMLGQWIARGIVRSCA